MSLLLLHGGDALWLLFFWLALAAGGALGLAFWLESRARVGRETESSSNKKTGGGE